MWPRFDGVNKNPLHTLFKPLFILQTLVGCARFNVFGKSIQQPKTWQKIYSIVYMILCALAYLLFTTNMNEAPILDTTTTQFVLSLAQIIANTLVNCGVVIVNNLIYRKENQQLFSRLQYIDIKLKVIGKPEHYNTVYNFIICALIFNSVFHVYYISAGVLSLPGFNKLVPLLSHLMIVDDLEMILLVSLVFLMYQRVKYINKILNRFSITKWKHSTHVNESEVFRRMWEAFKGIATAVRCIEKTCSVYILCCVFHFFLYHLFNMEISIVSNTQDHSRPFDLHKNWILLKYLAKIIALSLCINYFEISLECTKDQCYNVLRKNYNVISRQYVKNIARLLTHKLYPINVFRILNVNAVHYKLILLTTQYSIVLLQFAYL